MTKYELEINYLNKESVRVKQEAVNHRDAIKKTNDALSEEDVENVIGIRIVYFE